MGEPALRFAPVSTQTLEDRVVGLEEDIRELYTRLHVQQEHRLNLEKVVMDMRKKGKKK